MRLSSTIRKYWEMYERSAVMFTYYMFLFLPVFLGTIYLAHCLWAPYRYHFSTWWEGCVNLVLFIKQDYELDGLLEVQPFWAVAFIIYFYIVFGLFLVNGFLAITVHAYFQVQ